MRIIFTYEHINNIRTNISGGIHLKRINIIKIINLDNKKIEKNLIYGSSVFIVLLILVQAIMVNPDARNFITNEEQVEGVFLSDSKELINKGSIVAELQNADKMDNLWVMVNGKRIARFSGKRITLPVSDGELIEIDGTGINKAATVKIISKSENVKLLMNKYAIEVKANIAVLARVKISN